MNIRVVRHKDIDKIKWNSCVHYASNGNIYGYKWFLDNVAKEWDALVEGDYESVMPLIGRSKYLGIKELYLPILMRESGIYTIHALSEKRLKAFFDTIPMDYKVVTLHLNEHHLIAQSDFPNAEITILKNHQLLLNQSYETITQAYSPKAMQELEKAKLTQLFPTTSVKPETLVDFYKEHTDNRAELEQRYHAYLRIMYNALHRGWGTASGVLDANKNLTAVGFFMYSHSKVIRLFSAVSPEGQKKAADTYLFDSLIQRHATQPLILDFNSRHPFAADLGAEATFYQQFKLDYRKWKLF